MVTEEGRGSCMGVFLGTISYCPYLIHKFVRVHLIIPVFEGAGWNFWLVVFGICLPTVILLASIVTFLIEKPALQVIRNWYKKKQSQQEKMAGAKLVSLK